MTDIRNARSAVRVLTKTNVTAATAVQNARSAARILYALVPPVGAAAVKTWSGTAYVTAPLKVWSGSAFVDAVAVRTWNGTAFV